MDNPFKIWWKAATPAERASMSKICGTSVETLRQEAFAFRSGGKLKLSMQRAHDVSNATLQLSHRGLEPIGRGILNPLWNEKIQEN